MTYKAPLADQLFLLREVLEIEALSNVPGFAEATPDLVEQIVNEGARFAENVLAPLNRVGDKEGCIWSPDFTVTTAPGFKEAYAQLVESGFPALSSAPEYGGQGLATVVGAPYSEASSSANMAFAMYPGLTHGNYSAILEGGSEAQ